MHRSPLIEEHISIEDDAPREGSLAADVETHRA